MKSLNVTNRMNLEREMHTNKKIKIFSIFFILCILWIDIFLFFYTNNRHSIVKGIENVHSLEEKIIDNIAENEKFVVELHEKIEKIINNSGSLTIFGEVHFLESNTGELTVYGNVYKLLSNTGILKIEKGAVVRLVNASIYAKIYNAGTLHVLGTISNLQNLQNTGTLIFS